MVTKMIIFNNINNIIGYKGLDAKSNNHYNSNVFSKSKLTQDTFERRNISFGETMSDFVPYKEIQSRLLKVAFQDIEEPEYVRSEEDFNEFDEDHVQPIISYFDKNDVLRKKEFCTSSAINEILLFDEQGKEQKKITIFKPVGQRKNLSLKIYDYNANSDHIYKFSEHAESVISEEEVQY